MDRLASLLVCLFAAVSCVSAASVATADPITTYSSLPLPAGPTGDGAATSAQAKANDLAVATPVETTFLAALSSYGTETYDEVSATERSQNLHMNQQLAFNNFDPAVANFAAVELAPGFTVSGQVGLLEEPETPPDANDFIFTSPITAFGSYFLQAGDMSNVDTITLRLENTVLGTSTDVTVGTVGPGASLQNVFYFGVTDTNPFNKVTMLLSINTDGIVLDNTTAGLVPVPEPSSALLLLLAAGGAATVPWIRSVRRARASQLR
jgi:hypothetical protein